MIRVIAMHCIFVIFLHGSTMHQVHQEQAGLISMPRGLPYRQDLMAEPKGRT